MDGGRRSASRSSPGNASEGVEKKCANPSEKKFGLSPGAEKRSRGIWKGVPPIRTKMSVANSCLVSRGTVPVS